MEEWSFHLSGKERTMKKSHAMVEHKNGFRSVISVILAAVMLCMLYACGKTDMGQDMTLQADRAPARAEND